MLGLDGLYFLGNPQQGQTLAEVKFINGDISTYIYSWDDVNTLVVKVPATNDVMFIPKTSILYFKLKSNPNYRGTI